MEGTGKAVICPGPIEGGWRCERRSRPARVKGENDAWRDLRSQPFGTRTIFLISSSLAAGRHPVCCTPHSSGNRTPAAARVVFTDHGIREAQVKRNQVWSFYILSFRSRYLKEPRKAGYRYRNAKKRISRLNQTIAVTPACD